MERGWRPGGEAEQEKVIGDKYNKGFHNETQHFAQLIYTDSKLCKRDSTMNPINVYSYYILK